METTLRQHGDRPRTGCSSGCDKMDSAEDSWVVSVVKIEIDVAEEPPSAWSTERDEQGEKSH